MLTEEHPVENLHQTSEFIYAIWLQKVLTQDYHGCPIVNLSIVILSKVIVVVDNVTVNYQHAV